jgi:type II secretory pathway pseudopilin PulG
MNSTRNEDGFSLIVVIIALTIGSLLTVAALAAATGDLPNARKSQDRKAAYAAAESGLEYYKYQLSLNNDKWKTCYGTTHGVPNTNESYTITPLPANGQSACSTSAPEASMIDANTGSFRIRSTGTAGGVKRSIVATFRRKSFLDFIYYTTFETQDPPLYGSNPTPAWAAANCQQPRASRASSCVNIQFASADHINGPLHTDDDLLICGGTTFGRPNRDPPDSIEVSGPPSGWHSASGTSCSGSPTWNGTLTPNSDVLGMPDSNSALADAANVNYYGTTNIVLKGNVMDVTTRNAAGTADVTLSNVVIPDSAVIYVHTAANGCNRTDLPTNPGSYTTRDGCANVFISGNYSKDITIGTDKDIIVNGDVMRTRVGSVPADVELGLIASNYVRVMHGTTLDSNNNLINDTPYTMNDVTIEAAIMSVQHSFIVDNWNEGARLGTLTVFGAIAQKFRGPVGTSTPTGYTKNYNYDDRMHYRNPPSFLDALSAAWEVVRTNEQVPAV